MEQPNQLAQAHELISGLEGWGAMDESGGAKKKHEAALAQFHHCERLTKAFNNGAGPDCLLALVERFVDPPTWPAYLTNGEDQRAYGYIREGQKSVIKAILDAQKIVAAGPPQAPNAKKSTESMPT